MKRKLARNIAIYVFMFIISSALLFVSRAYVYRYMGGEIAGLASLFVSIMGFLNLSELGLSVAIMYALYKPLKENNYSQIKGIIDFYRSLYKRCSIAILIGGGIITLFINVFNKSSISNADVRIYFIVFLISNVISYYFYHNVTLFFVYEQAYIISTIDLITKAGKTFLQILIMILTRSYLNFLLLEIVSNLAYYVWLDLLAKRRFSFLYGANSEMDVNTKKDIFQNIKGAVVHKLGAYVVFGTDNLLISYFINVAEVGIYSNYMMVINFCGSLTAKVFEPLAATIGKFIAGNNDKDKIYDFFKSIYFINYVIAVNITTGLYFVLNDFVNLWLGRGKLIPYTTFVLIIINFYITAMRPSIERFKEAAGILYKDRYVAVIESVVNLAASFALVHRMGLSGVAAGTIISNITAVVIIKPYFTFRYVLNKPLIVYIFNYIKGAALLVINILFINFCSSRMLKIYMYKSALGTIMLKGFISVLTTNLILLVIIIANKNYRKLVFSFVAKK